MQIPCLSELDELIAQLKKVNAMLLEQNYQEYMDEELDENTEWQEF